MSARRGAATFGAFASCAVATSSGCYVDLGTRQHRTVSYAITAPAQAIVVHAHIGNVEVTGGDTGEPNQSGGVPGRGRGTPGMIG